jgi:hypothetical protein
MTNLVWKPAVCGYRLLDGFQPRAVIVPQPPRKWNGYCRWTVDAIRLHKAVNVKTLKEARALAEANA